MAKNNCCRICGRLDYDDDGEYLICRVCGEKRLKKQFPMKETLLSILFLVLGFYFLFLSYGIYTYNDSGSIFSQMLSPFDDYHNSIGSFNWAEAFLNQLDHNGQLIYLKWFLRIVSIVFFVLFALFIKKITDSTKKTIV